MAKVFRFIRQASFLGTFLALFTGMYFFNVQPSLALSGDMKTEISGGSFCWKITKVSLAENGYITLEFTESISIVSGTRHVKNWREKFCPQNKLFDVTTKPPNLIRGSRGVKGKTPSPTFFIQITDKVEKLYLKLLESNRVKVRKFSLKKPILELKKVVLSKASTPSWQKAFKSSESKLAAKANADKTPPSIIVFSPKAAESRRPIRVDSYKIFIRGRVTDKEGVMSVLVNGNHAGVKADGTFAAKLKLAIGKNQILVQAEDVNGNVAEKKFAIFREEYIPEQSLADVDMPPRRRIKNPDGLAVVIGIENYQYVPNATYAYNDAEVFREYLATTLGYNKAKVKIVTNKKATLAEFNKLLGSNGWLKRNVKPGKSDVVVYFSGHGIPDPKTKQTGLLPFDVDPNYSVGLPLKKLYKDLSGLNAKSVTVFLDACFTGQDREKRALLADTRSIMVVPIERGVPGNVTVLSAATTGQVSGAIKDKEHGLFTYYLLKGLGGVADKNKNRKLTLNELSSYVRSKVKERAALKGREQTPELQGPRNRVLVKW